MSRPRYNLYLFHHPRQGQWQAQWYTEINGRWYQSTFLGLLPPAVTRVLRTQRRALADGTLAAYVYPTALTPRLFP